MSFILCQYNWDYCRHEHEWYHKWNTEWQKNTFRLHTFIPSPGPSPPGMTLHRPSWDRLNRLRTGVGTVPLNNAQTGLGALGELQMRSRGANGRSHTVPCHYKSFLSPVLSSKWDTWFDGSRWWHCGLASNNCTQHLTKSAQTKKNMSVKKICCISLPNKLSKGQTMLFRYFFQILNIAYVICNLVSEM